MTPEKKKNERKNWAVWLKNIGLLGFFFFLAKGLIWLGIFIFAGKQLFD